MIFKVQMWAFMDGMIREVDVPDHLIKNNIDDLDAIYMYGQNEMRSLRMCSVSPCDVIEYNDELYLIAMCGFEKMSKAEYDEYIKSEDKIMKIFG